MKYVLYLCRKKLLAKENRTFLSILSVALITSIQIFNYGLITSLENYFSNSLYSPDQSFIYVVNGTSLDNSSFTYKSFIYNESSIKAVLPILLLQAKYNSSNLELRATDADFFKVFSYAITGDQKLGNNDLIVGIILAKLFNLTIGEHITLDLKSKKENFTIVAFLNSHTSFDYAFVTSIDFIWSLFPEYENKVSYLLIQPSPSLNLTDISQQIKSNLGKEFNIVYNDRNKILNQVFQSPIYALNLWSSLLNVTIFLLAFMITLNNIRRMRSYMALLMSLGMRKIHIFSSILIENLIITSIGYLFGLVLGIMTSSSLIKGISAIVEAPLAFNPNYFMIFFPSSLNFIGFLAGAGVALLIFRRRITVMIE